MSKETNDVDIRRLYMQMRDELQYIVYTAVAIGGVLGFCVSLAIAGLTDVRRLAIIFLGCVGGYYLGKLRKQDLYEKSLLMYYLLDLLPKTAPEESKVEKQEAPQKDVVATESVAPKTTSSVSDGAATSSQNVPDVPSKTVPTEAKETTKTVVKKIKGKPTKLTTSK